MDTIDPADLAARIADGRAPIVVDTRSALEFARGHVPGAIHIPFWTMPWRAEALPAARQDEIVVYCGHGPRAMMAAAALRRRGFTHVRLLRGHWARWESKGKG